MKKIIQLISCFLVIISISIICHSCKQSSEPSDLNSLVQCGCNDMDCWRTKTTEKMWGSLKCAAESGLLAAGIGFANKIKKTVESGKKVSNAIQNAHKTIQASQDIVSDYEGLHSLVDPVFWTSALSTISDKVDLNNKGIECGKKAAEIIAGILLFALATKSYFDSNASTIDSSVSSDESAVEQMTEFTLNTVKASKEGVSFDKAMAGLTVAGALTCTTCLSAIAKSSSKSPIVQFVKDIISPLGDFIENALVFVVLADCGYQLTTSSVYLLANTACLVSDLAAVYDSYKQLEKAYDNTLKTGVDCNEESKKSCSDTIARNYGMALHKMISNQSWTTYLYQGSRASQCYNYCYTYAGSKEKCHSNSISLGSNLTNPQACRSKCETQTGECLALCRSFCCNQDGNCVNKVKSIQESRKK